MQLKIFVDFASPRHWRGRCISINSRVILNGCNRIECSSAKSYARSIPNGDPSLCAGRGHDAYAHETGLTFRIIPAHRADATYGGGLKNPQGIKYVAHRGDQR